MSREKAAFFSCYEKFRLFGMGRNESNLPPPFPRPSTQKNPPLCSKVEISKNTVKLAAKSKK